jgi:hypothetical protein
MEGSEGKIFWSWFTQNHIEYQKLDSLDSSEMQQKLDTLLERLHIFSDALYFEILNKKDNDNELIITAGGDSSHFEKAEQLISSAPKIEGWKFIGLKKRTSDDFITVYEGLEIDPKKLWFLPLENPKFRGKIGLRICSKNYSVNQKDKFTNAVYVVLDSLLGEEFVSNRVIHLETGILPLNFEQEGYINLMEIYDYMVWKGILIK